MKKVNENKTRKQIMGKREKVSIALQKVEDVLIQLDPIQTIAVLKTLNKKYGYKATLGRERSKRYLNKIDLDPELKAFLLSLKLEDLRKTEVLKLCIKKFGKERSPSYSGLNRALPKLLAARYEEYK
uniref:hypothetical protein n=1 Tax=Vibrio harveyi TaxID=669 RepID=UPI00068377CB|nr:hypothetical protein [Vibrio harveyi]